MKTTALVIQWVHLIKFYELEFNGLVHVNCKLPPVSIKQICYAGFTVGCSRNYVHFMCNTANALAFLLTVCEPWKLLSVVQTIDQKV